MLLNRSEHKRHAVHPRLFRLVIPSGPMTQAPFPALSPHSAGPDQAEGRHLPHARRAIANGLLSVGALLALAGWSGCGRHPSAQPAAGPPSVHDQLVELVEAMTPLDKTVTSDISDKRFLRGQELLGKLRAGGRETGLEAMRMLREEPPAGKPRPTDVERALIDVAAHAAPEDVRPLLVSLVTQFGPSLALRTEATLLLGETSPAQALEVLGPIVKNAHPTQTMAPAEFTLRAFVTACDKTGRSAVPELADIATNLYMDETARIRAVKELGHRPEPLALQALQAILVESTGDGYLRRMAAQGLRDSLPKENACEMFQRVAENEADLNFLQFLRDMLDKNCSPVK